jgi:hypothetical protein
MLRVGNISVSKKGRLLTTADLLIDIIFSLAVVLPWKYLPRPCMETLESIWSFIRVSSLVI